MGYKAYGCGGYAGDGDTGNLYEYDLSDNAWTTRTARSYAVHAGCGGGAVYDDLYIWGGMGGEPNNRRTTKWDIAGLSWSDRMSMPSVATFGHYPSFGGWMYANDGLKYNYANDTWRGITKTTFVANAACALNAYLYIFGDNTESFDTCMKMNTENEVWTQIANKYSDLAYDNMRVGSQDGTYGYIWGGGSCARETWYGQTERYDIASNTWLRRSGTCTGASAKSGHQIGTKIYTAGGNRSASGQPAINTHEEYDDSTQTWTGKTAYPRSNQYIITLGVPSNKPPNAPSGLSVSAT